MHKLQTKLTKFIVSCKSCIWRYYIIRDMSSTAEKNVDLYVDAASFIISRVSDQLIL